MNYLATFFTLVNLIFKLAFSPEASSESSRDYYFLFRTPSLQVAQMQVEIHAKPVLSPSTTLRVNSIKKQAYRLVVDISENGEYLYSVEDGLRLIQTNPVSTGSATRYDIPYYTPLGQWKIISKERSSGVFGPYFLRLAKWDGSKYVRTSIGLHGTDEPELLGQPASKGCIRHENSVIVQLSKILPVGTEVLTVE